jgi:hypothetical protein
MFKITHNNYMTVCDIEEKNDAHAIWCFSSKGGVTIPHRQDCPIPLALENSLIFFSHLLCTISLQ